MKPKLLENCKIAVCFSGQSRTFKYCAESINNFFTSDRGNQFVFFGHTWDGNDYKIKTSKGVEMKFEKHLDVIELENNLRNLFNFESLIVEKEKYRPYPWASMFYSKMRSNFLKQKFEVVNNMMFDLVIKCRFDLCFRHEVKFENYFNRPIEEKTLYGYYGLMQPEFFLPVPDDVIYYGTSLTMDLVDSLYTSLCSGSFLKLVGHNSDNPAYTRVGPNVLIYKWASMKNILPMHNPLEYLVYRKTAEGIDYKTSWEELRKIGNMIY